MNALMISAILFGALLAPAQEIQIGEMKDLGGGVLVAQNGEFLYLSVPAGTELRVGDTVIVADHGRLQIMGHDDPWWLTASDNGVFKILSERLGVSGAGEIVIAVRQPSGEFIDQKVENIAGKVTLLPGDVTLIEGQQLWVTTLVFGAPSEVRLTAGFKQLKLGTEKRKSTLATGAVVTEYLEGYELPVGNWKVTFSGRNAGGVFSDTIRVRVLKKIPIVECCPDILK